MVSAPSAPHASPPLQRRSEERSRSDWAQQARADPRTQVLLARGTTLLVRHEPQTAAALLLPHESPLAALDDSRLILLGWFEGRRCVLADLPPELPFELAGARFEELRALLALLRQEEGQLLSCARALLIWRSRHRYCGVCAAPTEPRAAGHVLACSACGNEFFPRIDPAVIVLVTSGSRALLGRQASWPAGRYSALAGFVEAGETLEQAVAREVEEETGVRLDSMHYIASQPWPFPASLMVGFHAQAPFMPVQLDGELEDARWFERTELQSAATGLLPPSQTIARRLIDHWLQPTPPA